ncbi:hypothetical protein [Aquimarina algicola]|uniref:Uncharacterized protein n=1 Tax=Aquimarina algicola TaxID=2589995 RepID=A0A504JNE8_9FLAO|nr:hypothetical protein [Aquimarina algicola]TPN89253.1 hypothetical protein FHK87_03225 [Aquimarina algicola]
MIKKDGYYISEAFKSEDWHAGHKFESQDHKILIFLNNKKIIRDITENQNSFDINKCISESNSKDTYKIVNNIIEITIDPDSKFSKKREFTILSPELLLDENLVEYHFIPNQKSEFDF